MGARLGPHRYSYIDRIMSAESVLLKWAAAAFMRALRLRLRLTE